MRLRGVLRRRQKLTSHVIALCCWIDNQQKLMSHLISHLIRYVPIFHNHPKQHIHLVFIQISLSNSYKNEYIIFYSHKICLQNYQKKGTQKVEVATKNPLSRNHKKSYRLRFFGCSISTSELFPRTWRFSARGMDLYIGWLGRSNNSPMDNSVKIESKDCERRSI